jgi:peptidoglycan/LPS O-acetylase OafA/YrhL
MLAKQPIDAKQQLHGIQILRGIAALAVVFHHTLEQSNGAATRFSPDWLTTFGAAGVDIFFVISGFIMLYTSLVPGRPAMSPGTFLFRRFVRIYPFYWIICGAMMLILASGFLKSHHYALRDIVLSLALLPSGNLLIGVSWTLVYEIFFYLIFATMLLSRSEKAVAFGTVAAIMGTILIAHAVGQSSLAGFFSNPISLEFCFGLCLALLYRRYPYPVWMRTVAPYFVGLGLLIAALAPLIVPHTNTTGLPGLPRLFAWGLPALLIVGASLELGAPENAVGRVMLLLGDASYAIYLTHVFVMIGYGWILKHHQFSNFPQILVVPFIVLMASGTGIVAHRYVENPLQSSLKSLLGGRKSTR